MQLKPAQHIDQDLPSDLGGGSLFVASDFHLGAPNRAESLEREKRIVRWMDSIKERAAVLIFLGDVFDFWFEYRHVVPKGFVRFLGKAAELSDNGTKLVFFGGNHDMWMRRSFTEDFAASFYTEPCQFALNGKKFYVHHGDGLGPGDGFYKTIRGIFTNKLLYRLARQLHPDLLAGFAHAWSGESRKVNRHKDEVFLGDDEWLWAYAKSMEEKEHFDYYVFGHRHLPLELPVGDSSTYFNSGEWINYQSFLEFDGQALYLRYFR